MRDLVTLHGLERYVRGEVAEAVNQSLQQSGEVAPIGVVLATRNGSEPLSEPLPAIYGGFNVDPVQVKSVLMQNARKLVGTGVIFVEADGSKVRFRLEHKVHGDLEWVASVTRDKATRMLGEIKGPKTVAPGNVTRFLPARYMS